MRRLGSYCLKGWRPAIVPIATAGPGRRRLGRSCRRLGRDAQPGAIDLTGTVDTAAASSKRAVGASPAGVSPRPPSTTSPARPTAAEPRSTASSRAARTRSLAQPSSVRGGRLCSRPRHRDSTRPPTLEDVLIVAITGAATFLAEHEVLPYLSRTSREVLLPLHRLRPPRPDARPHARAFLAPYLERLRRPEAAGEHHRVGHPLVVSY